MKHIGFIVGAGLLAVATATPAVSADLPRQSYKAPSYVAPFSCPVSMSVSTAATALDGPNGIMRPG
jgi:hypothetical protein